MHLVSGYSELSSSSFRSRSVETVWTYLAQETHEHHVLPDGRCDIILRFNTDGYKPIGEIKVLIAGPATTFHMVPMVKGLGYVGIRLRPAFANQILGLELSSIVDQVIGGEAALQAAPSLKTLCLPAPSIEVLVDDLRLFVEMRSKSIANPVRALALIDALHLSGGRLNVTELAQISNIDERTVRREFKVSTGLAPKQFAIIIQFNRALRLLQAVGLDVISAAAEAGYADQAHMTRAFRKLGGFTPAKIPQFALPNLSL